MQFLLEEAFSAGPKDSYSLPAHSEIHPSCSQ